MKQHTIIFVPHTRAQFRKWRISTLQAYAVIGSLALLTLGGIIAAALYFDTSFDRSQLDQIRTENADLRAVNQRFESSVRDLEGQLEDYQQRIHKLAIVAGLAELSPGTEPGIGGIEPLAGSGDLDDSLQVLQRQLQGLGQNLEELGGHLDQRQIMVSSLPTIAPSKGILTSGYGFRTDPFTKRRAYHRGLDIVAPYGHEVVAPGDAIVTKSGRSGSYGNVVYLSHGYGITTRYGHLSKLNVEEGQRVSRGDVIGFVGNTGRSTGTHLHYEVRIDGLPKNPLAYIMDGNH